MGNDSTEFPPISSHTPLGRVERAVRQHEEELNVIASRFGKKKEEADKAERAVREAYQYINQLIEQNPTFLHRIQHFQGLCSDEVLAARLLRENGGDTQKATTAWWKEHNNSEAAA